MVEVVEIVEVFSYNFYDYAYISIFESKWPCIERIRRTWPIFTFLITFKDLQNHIQYIYTFVQTLDNFRISILKHSRN